MPGQRVRTQCPSLLELPLRIGSTGVCGHSCLQFLGLWGSGEGRGGPCRLEEHGRGASTGPGLLLWDPSGTAHPEDGPGSTGSHPWCPSWSSGCGLWMVLSKGSAGFHGHSRELPGVRQGWLCSGMWLPKEVNRGREGFVGWWGLEQGHVPSAHCTEGMRASRPVPLVSSRSFLC